jgi:hypothetical protein
LYRRPLRRRGGRGAWAFGGFAAFTGKFRPAAGKVGFYPFKGFPPKGLFLSGRPGAV